MAAILLTAACAKEEVTVSSLQETHPSKFGTSEYLTPAEGGLTVVHAGFDTGAETRSRLELNADDTQADVLWTAGDTFAAVFANSEGAFGYRVDFTTQYDGVVDGAFSTPYRLSGYKWFNCFYPDGPIYGNYNGHRIFGLDLPGEQTAVAGGIAEGLNRAYAYADELTKDNQNNLQGTLTFRNLTSMIRFRLDGAVASQVKEVTFIGSGVLAGDIIFQKSAEDSPELEEVPGLHYSRPHYSKIVLKGDFEAGKDYYIVLWPRQLNGFRMEFSDGNGSYTTKYSRKSVRFEASRIKDFGTISLGDEFDFVNDGSLDPVKYMSATEGTKPVTIAVIPDGFTKDELPQYELLAKSGINALFDTEPYKTYRNRFNVYILKVPSHESGASVTDGSGNVTTPVSNYFGSRWGETSYSDMRADDTTIYDFVSEHCPDIVDGTHTTSEVPVLMIINDERYGGICWSYSDGKGYAMAPYSYNGDGVAWSLPENIATTDEPLPEPVTGDVMQQYSRRKTQADLDEVGGVSYGDWRNTLVHEFGGHCFGRLGDEYWYNVDYVTGSIGGHTWTVPMGLNNAYDYSAVPWKEDLLDRLDELTARDARYARIGRFQGADHHLFGRWRSEKISCMIDNRFYFSAWQRYLIAKRIFTLSGDGESFNFDDWLANDVPIDPVRDLSSGSVPGWQEHRTYRFGGPLPPPVLVEVD